MFGKKNGYSNRLTFNDIYDLLKFAIAENNEPLAIDMFYEYTQYPNYLKKCLIRICCEIIPNLILINEIYKTKSDMKELFKYVSLMCSLHKTQDHIYLLYDAAKRREEFIKAKSTEISFIKYHGETLKEISDKLYIYCCNNMKYEFIKQICMKKYKKFPLTDIYKFINEDISFLCTIALQLSKNYVYMRNPHFNYNNNISYNIDYKFNDCYKAYVNKDYCLKPTIKEVAQQYDIKYINKEFNRLQKIKSPTKEEKELWGKLFKDRVYYKYTIEDENVPQYYIREIFNNIDKYIKPFIGKIVKWNQFKIFSKTETKLYNVYKAKLKKTRIIKGPYKTLNTLYKEYNADLLLYFLTNDIFYDSYIYEIDNDFYLSTINYKFSLGKDYDISTLTEDNEKELLISAMLKNVIGDCGTCYYNNIVYDKHNKIHVINNSIKTKTNEYLFNLPLLDKSTANKFYDIVKKHFDFITNMINIYIDKLTNNNIPFIGISDKEKSDITKFAINTLRKYYDINNWRF